METSEWIQVVPDYSFRWSWCSVHPHSDSTDKSQKKERKNGPSLDHEGVGGYSKRSLIKVEPKHPWTDMCVRIRRNPDSRRSDSMPPQEPKLTGVRVSQTTMFRRPLESPVYRPLQWCVGVPDPVPSDLSFPTVTVRGGTCSVSGWTSSSESVGDPLARRVGRRNSDRLYLRSEVLPEGLSQPVTEVHPLSTSLKTPTHPSLHPLYPIETVTGLSSFVGTTHPHRDWGLGKGPQCSREARGPGVVGPDRVAPVRPRHPPSKVEVETDPF